MPHRMTAKFGTQTRDNHVQDSCWVLCLYGSLTIKQHFSQKITRM